MRFQVQGDTELVAQLDIFDGDALKDALRDAGQWIMDEAYDRAPVSPGGGELKSRINMRLQNDSVDIVAEADHARYVEYGTGLFTTKQTFAKKIPWNYQDKKGLWHKTYGQHPQPFLVPAFYNNRDRIVRRFAQLIKGGSNA